MRRPCLSVVSLFIAAHSFLCGPANAADSEIYFPVYSEMALESFENRRPEICAQNLKYLQDMETVSQGGVSQFPEQAQEYAQWIPLLKELNAGFAQSCSLGGTNLFLRPALETFCGTPDAADAAICNQFFSVLDGTTPDLERYVMNSFKELMGFDFHQGWVVQETDAPERPWAAVAVLRRGNFILIYSIYFQKIILESPKHVALKNKKFIYLIPKGAEAENSILVPTLEIACTAFGIADTYFDVRVDLLAVNGTNLQVEPVWLAHLNWDEPFEYSETLTDDRISLLSQAFQIQMVAQYPEDQEPIFIAVFENAGFRKAFQGLLLKIAPMAESLETYDPGP
jgi:hypothetical protein